MLTMAATMGLVLIEEDDEYALNLQLIATWDARQRSVKVVGDTVPGKY